tara:strand:- start:49 stop:555 length:507 start_codon:yes stop_codon:yes gene_type:complete
MNNRYNELDNTLQTSIDVLIDSLASCQNETQNEEIFNEIIKDAFKEIETNHQCYLRYKEIETNKIKKNRMKKTILTEIENNNNFVLDLNYLKYYKHLDNTHIAQMIIDAPFTQLLSYFYYYEDISIDYNSDTLNSIVLDIHNLITTKPFYNRLLKTINVELDLLDCTK